MHSLEQKAEQLRDAGIWPDAPTGPGQAPPPDLSWIIAEERPDRRPEAFGLREPFCLLVPGASVHRPGKRWPTAQYSALASLLVSKGLDVGVIGGPAEASLAASIPWAKDLTGKTDLLQVGALGARAMLVVGNDTGPTHLLAAAGAPTLVLFSADSNPALCAPRGRRVTVLRRDQLAELSLEAVVAAIRTVAGHRMTF